MAEALLNHLAGDRFDATSAGLEPGRLNPIVIEAMRHADIDISHKSTKSVDSIIQGGGAFDYVGTECDDASSERCPVCPGMTKRLHGSFPDPSRVTSSFEEKSAATAKARDEIRDRLRQWI